MNWEAIGAIGEVVGAGAVVVTLIFLTLQIRQHTRQMRRAELNAAAAQFSVPRMAVVSDRSLAELLLKANRAPDEMDEVSQLQLDMWFNEQINAVFHAWDRARSGSFEKELWETATKPFLVQLLAVEAGSRWWDRNRLGFVPEFRAEVDRMREAPA